MNVDIIKLCEVLKMSAHFDIFKAENEEYYIILTINLKWALNSSSTACTAEN